MGIAACCWRAGMTVLVRRMYPWVDTWIHEDLFGGIQGRSADLLHDLLQSDSARAVDAAHNACKANPCSDECRAAMYIAWFS